MPHDLFYARWVIVYPTHLYFHCPITLFINVYHLQDQQHSQKKKKKTSRSVWMKGIKQPIEEFVFIGSNKKNVIL